MGCRSSSGLQALAALVLIQVVQQGELRHEPLLADAAALELTAGEEAPQTPFLRIFVPN